jgi:hypothetical protein
MTKTLERALAEIARLSEAEQDRIGRELLADMERLRGSSLAVRKPGRPMSAADLDELARLRSTMPLASTDAGTLISAMRDEGEK